MRKQYSIRSFSKKAGKIMVIFISSISALILLLVITLIVISPGKPKQYLNKNGSPLAGSLSEKLFVNINGTKQGMFIKSKDISNPVLLYLHGGMPDYFLTDNYPTGLEDLFTVVWWEQRGSGISYSGEIPAETMNLDQMISDTIEITKYLQTRFEKEKIYLMGHSGGTFIGIQAAKQAPELYSAYIGVAQMSNQLKSETLAYEYMLKVYEENGNLEMVNKLRNSPVSMYTGVSKPYLALRDNAMHELGIGTTHDMHSVLTGIFLPSLAAQDYTVMEKINMWRGKSHSGVSSLWDEMLITDLSKIVDKLDIPVYFFEGIYDYTVSYSEAKTFFRTLNAPIKGFYTFEKSAHSPIFEEPDKVKQIMRSDVLTGNNTLSEIK